MKGDKDGDETIDKKEAKELALKISLQLQAYDVGFDTGKFLKVVAKDSSVSGILNIILRLLPKEEEEEEEEKADKRYYDDSSDSDEDSDDEEYGEFVFIVFNEGSCVGDLLTLSIFADMFYMGVSAASTGGSGCEASVFSAASGVGVSLMKTDRRRMSASRALLKSMRTVGTFGP